MQYHHSNDKAQAYFEEALEHVKANNLPFTPEIYEIFYVHISGGNPELSHAIKLYEVEGKPFAFSDCEKIYQKFLNVEEDVAHVRDANTQIQTSIQDMNAVVTDVKQTTEQYNEKLIDASEKLNNGEADPEQLKNIIETVMHDTEAILGKNKRLEEELSRQANTMVELQNDLDRVKREALTDGLTNIANRKAFDQEALNLIGAAENDESLTFSLILIDIDHFKAFNDNYGHQVGDQVLRLVARTLTDGVKGRDFVARYGGEEFTILLPGTNQHAAKRVGDDLREAVASKDLVNRNTGDRLGQVTLSAGVTEFYVGDNLDDLIERADEALYRAKNAGRNRVSMAQIEVVRGKKA